MKSSMTQTSFKGMILDHARFHVAFKKNTNS